MESLRTLLLHHEILLLFVVIGLGYVFGQMKIAGFSVGIAGVMFVGLAFGAWCPQGGKPFQVPRQIAELGLILFVYNIGLTSGPGFFSSLKQRGLRYNILTVLSLGMGAFVAFALGHFLSLTPALISGVFCGSLTNTPGLAAVTQLIPGQASLEPALGYSVAYPLALVIFVLSFQFFSSLKSKELEQEKEALQKSIAKETEVVVCHYEIHNPAIIGHPIGALKVQDVTGLIISRIRHGKEVTIPNKYTLLQEGDVVVCVGTKTNQEKGKAYFGATSPEHLDINSDKIEMRRILVSNKKLVGKTIDELELSRRFNAQITRLRRADVDIVPSPNMVLEIGDRLRVVMSMEQANDVCKFFGDSARDIAELDFTAITIGISLGVMIGMIPIPLPGGAKIALGIAGGPLVVALILGKLGRTGPFVWSIPLESSHAIRNIGLLLFFAGVGINSGSQFGKTFSSNGLQLILLSVMISTVSTMVMLFGLYKFAKSGVVATLGATSGMHTQPASLAKAHDISHSDEVYITYAVTYPISMISKIILAQLIYIIGSALGK